MHRIQCGTIPIPVLYVCEDTIEARKVRAAGIPYIIRPNGMTDKKLVAYVLLNVLETKFPHIDWFSYLGLSSYIRKELIVHVPGMKDCDSHKSGDDAGGLCITDIADDEREFTSGIEGDDYGERDLSSYIGNAAAAHVKIEELQDLNLLPTFLDDIAEAIKKNLYGMYWSEGFNKKRGVPLGNFDAGGEKPNLIILDVSGSIPKGVSATMLTLIETLRDRANADLIVTGSCSMYWAAGEKLPSPEWIRSHIGYNNEATQFNEIIRTRIAGRQWGNVIAFGDNDCPSAFWGRYSERDKAQLTSKDLEGTTVENLLSFHTFQNYTPGYARWVDETPGVLLGGETINTEWCDFME